jgi:hypothetical protein
MINKAAAFDLNVHSSDGMHTINDNQLPTLDAVLYWQAPPKKIHVHQVRLA